MFYYSFLLGDDAGDCNLIPTASPVYKTVFLFDLENQLHAAYIASSIYSKRILYTVYPISKHITSATIRTANGQHLRHIHPTGHESRH